MGKLYRHLEGGQTHTQLGLERKQTQCEVVLWEVYHFNLCLMALWGAQQVG